MTDRRFVHLHCHSHYSLLDGANRIPELVAHTKKHGMNAIALTDHGNLYGAIEFYRECSTAGLNPIVGYEAYVAPSKLNEREARRRGEAGFHLTILAKDSVGFRNLVKMASVAFLNGYHYVPRIDKELLEAHKEGLICLSGCASGEFSEFILKDQFDEAIRLASWFAKVFGKNFYVEIQNNGLDLQRRCAEGAIDIANKLGLPLVATSDAHYLCQGDAAAHDVLLCINTGRLRKDENRMRYGSEQFYVRVPQEMYELFPGHEDAVGRSQEIADSCSLKLDFKKRHFPVFTPPDKKKPEDFLRELCAAGMRERYGDNPAQAVRDRLEHELGIICRMGFASYFLIVWDFVRFALENKIPASARGSACGAVVSYVLKLSHVDPLEYDLLFERFLDPNRSEAPDIDIDFCQERREEVIAYVRQRYGEQSVAQIGTFGTLAARAAIKDVGRVLDIPLERVTRLTNLVPKTLGITLDSALEQSADLRQEYNSDPAIRELIDIARKLEGTNRNAGTHAAGVVIANGPLTDYVPLQRIIRKGEDGAKREEAIVTTQWEMGDLEKVGMLKMDFLGLRTLTLLDNCVKLIEQTRGEKLDLYDLPPDNAKTYALLQRGDAKGVFQLESDGIRELLKRMKPDNIRDIVAIMALYRPGPLQGGMVDAYVNRKHGREKPTYPHPVMEEILTETYGVMCIHEDVRVSLADGSERPIRDVRRGDRVHALNRTANRFEIKECHGCGPTRRDDGLKITLENGFCVTVTADHEVLTYEGFKEARCLNVETDLVSAALRLEQEQPTFDGIASWLGSDEAIAYLFGYLLGDGCLTSSGITIATGVRPNHDKLRRWLDENLGKLRTHEYFHCRSWYLNLSCPDLLAEPGHGNRKTKLHRLLEVHGLKVGAAAKHIPDIIFRSASNVRAAFLAGLFDSDGCLTATGKGVSVAFVTSVSPKLLQGLRRLCQLEGIAVHLTQLRIQIWNVDRLQKVIEPYLVIKEFKGKLTSGTTAGWIPRPVLLNVVTAATSQRAFCRATGIQRRSLRHDFAFVKSSTAAKVGIELGQVRFFRIANIERVRDQQFYGMSVADHHNLVANGIVVKNCYQEQVMRILNRLGGIELSKAYACIKAISKKKHETIEQSRAEFVKGTQERGVAETTAREIFDLIAFFGGYGFNKSHSAAYAQVGYQTAYLKANYTPEFMAALLSSEIEDGNKRDIMVEHFEDAKKLGYPVQPPNINRGMPDFTVNDGQLIFGLVAIKGFGRGAAEEVVRAREQGKFKDIFDFCERVDLKIVTKAAIEKLIKAGALDCFRAHRSQLMHVLGRAIQAAGEMQEDKRHGQLNLFEAFNSAAENGATSEALPDIEEWPASEKLKYEKEALDFYISSHPLAPHEEILTLFSTHNVGQLHDLPAGQEVVMGGMLTQVRLMNTKKARNGNSRYARFKLEDFTGLAECVMWPDDFVRHKDEVEEDHICFVVATVERTREEPGLVVTRLMTLDQVRQERTTGLVLYLHPEEHGKQHLEQAVRILQRSPGHCPVFLCIHDLAGKRAMLKASEEFRINPRTVAKAELETLLGQGRVVFSRQGNGNGRAR